MKNPLVVEEHEVAVPQSELELMARLPQQFGENAVGTIEVGGSSRFMVQVMSADLTRLFWREPSDVSTARLGAVPASVMALPSR